MDIETVVIACHCYKADADKFKELCRKQGRFHAEVLRELISHYNKYIERGWEFSRDRGWTEKPVL